MDRVIFGLNSLKIGRSLDLSLGSDLVRSLGFIIESRKTGESYNFTRSDAKPSDLYTFVAYVTKVVDGDTLHAEIDCGFGVWSQKTFRLNGINSPEIKTQKGKQAKNFVQECMMGVSFVVVKIYKQEKYGRYLADVYYKPGESDPMKVCETGFFLNQQLLDRDFANVYI